MTLFLRTPGDPMPFDPTPRTSTPQHCLFTQVQGSTMTLFLRTPGDPMPEDIGGDEDKTLAALGVQVRV